LKILTKSNEPQRLDLLLLALGLASTRTKSQALIAEGKVVVDGEVITSAGAKFLSENKIELKEPEHPYVSRGGLKLAAALEAFRVSAKGLRAFDVGQSTGGFTDCLLRAGAEEVTGVDVGIGQLAESLRSSKRVKYLEKMDIRNLDPAAVRAPFPLFVADLSFISLSLVLPAIAKFLEPGAHGIVLVKPQFELSPGEIGSGGIVRDDALREKALARVIDAAKVAGFTVAGNILSPVQGGDGNQEYLVHLRWPSSATQF
jgi:23S rRNA (cytidine1920-2'-O)/16S rRNA (cytidine1409-2'-O)-methyltransferase